MLGHTLIHALVTTADQNQPLKLRQFTCDLLVEALALRGKQNNTFRGGPLLAGTHSHCFHTFKDRFRLQYHALAAAKRAVIHGAVPVFRKRPQIVNNYLNQACFASPPSDSVIKRATKEIRENRDNLNLHGLRGYESPVAPASLPRLKAH